MPLFHLKPIPHNRNNSFSSVEVPSLYVNKFHECFFSHFTMSFYVDVGIFFFNGFILVT